MRHLVTRDGNIICVSRVAQILVYIKKVQEIMNFMALCVYIPEKNAEVEEPIAELLYCRHNLSQTK